MIPASLSLHYPSMLSGKRFVGRTSRAAAGPLAGPCPALFARPQARQEGGCGPGRDHNPFHLPSRVSGAWLLALAAIACLSPLAAHDMWIEPANFSPQPGQIVSVKLRVGQDLLGDPVPRDPALVNQFVVADSTGRKPVVGRDGADPAGFVRVAALGLLVIGYRSNPTSIELPAEKFNQYLKEEGLDAVAALRARRKETGARAHDLFSRCAKSLVLSGSPSEAQHDRSLGFTLELVAERNPYAVRPGEDLPVRLTYENRPLTGALVVAMNRLNPSAKLSTRTDSGGPGRFRLPSP